MTTDFGDHYLFPVDDCSAWGQGFKCHTKWIEDYCNPTPTSASTSPFCLPSVKGVAKNGRKRKSKAKYQGICANSCCEMPRVIFNNEKQSYLAQTDTWVLSDKLAITEDNFRVCATCYKKNHREVQNARDVSDSGIADGGEKDRKKRRRMVSYREVCTLMTNTVKY